MNRLADPARPPRNGSRMRPVAARPSPAPTGPNTPGDGWPGCASAFRCGTRPSGRHRRPASGVLATGHQLITERGAPPIRWCQLTGRRPDYADGEIRNGLKAWMSQSCCWNDMAGASTPYASGCGKNHGQQKLARSTMTPGVSGGGHAPCRSRVRGGHAPCRPRFPGRPRPRRPCACPGGGSGSGRTAGLPNPGRPSRR